MDQNSIFFFLYQAEPIRTKLILMESKNKTRKENESDNFDLP